MTAEREVWVEQNLYRVVLSDEREALLTAKAAGRIAVGLLHRADEDPTEKSMWKPGEDLSCVRYLTEDVQTDTSFLERVVRRELGLPWIIAESDRIMIREFVISDIGQAVREAEDTEADAVFYTPELLESYIQNQYGFYECGIWAVVRKADKRLLGKAGVVQEEGFLELGYHIFAPYRRQGYAKEACRLILGYVGKEYLSDDSEAAVVRARTKPENTASVRLLQSLGFERSIPEAWFQKLIK